jgi:excisionase family DNA binding protein
MSEERKRFPVFLTIEEAAEYSGLSTRTIRDALSRRPTPLRHFKVGEHFKIHRDSIEEFFLKLCIG